MIDWSFLYLSSEWIIRLAMLLYVPQRRSTAASRTWLLFIFLLPWPGLVLYALVGRIRLPELRRKLQAQAALQIEKAQAQIGKRIILEPDLPAQLRIIPQQARKLGTFETFAGNALEFLRDYEGSIDRLITDIDSAEKTLLYIEDNLSNLRLIERIFEKQPRIKLLAAMQGGLGLDLAREHCPDLILLDVNLPDIPGAEVLRRLRGEKRTGDIPVVVVSADATARQIDRLMAAGATDYLVKPIEVKKFLRAVEKVLGPREAAPVDFE